MLKLIVKFPQMEAARKEVSAENEAAREANFRKWYAAETKAMTTLEETAFALAMERVRRKSGTAGYYSDHIGLNPDYSVEKGGFEIEGWLLYPELIDSLESLQSLGAFEMHFEDESGKEVSGDWWRDEEEWTLYEPNDYELDAFMERKMAEAVA